MGATNKIKGTNLGLQLDDKECPQCQQIFTQEEIDDRNYEVWFDTTNDVDLKEMKELEKQKAENMSLEYFQHLYFPFREKKGYQLTIWIRSIEHEYCPEVETCQKCGSKYLTKQMKELEGEGYCQACYVHLIGRKETKNA